MKSEFVADGHPLAAEVVPAAEDLQVVAVGHQLLDELVDLGGFLALSAPVAEDDVGGDCGVVVAEGALVAHQAGLLGVLQVEPVSLRYLAVDCLLHPVDGVHHLVAPLLLHHVDRELEFGVDHPDEDEAFLLQGGYWDLLDGLVAQAGVLDGHTAGGLGGGESPGRVHHDHVEFALSYFQLFLDEEFEVELGDVGADGYGVVAHEGFHLCLSTAILKVCSCYLRQICLYSLIFCFTSPSNEVSLFLSVLSRSMMQLLSQISELFSSLNYSSSAESIFSAVFTLRRRFSGTPQCSSSSSAYYSGNSYSEGISQGSSRSASSASQFWFIRANIQINQSQQLGQMRKGVTFLRRVSKNIKAVQLTVGVLVVGFKWLFIQ